MKIICAKEALMKGVNIVSKAVPSRTTMPILECILLDATTDVIKMTANDMEMGIETRIDGSIEAKGMVAIDARILSEIIRKLPDNDVIIETSVKEGSVQTHISCEKANFNIASKDGEEFSYLPYIERNNSIRLSQFTLKEIIRQTIFSIAANENNKLMTGELFEVNGNILRVVSLDGHRISIRKVELKENYDSKKVVVPGKSLMDVSRILTGGTDEEVEIFFAPNHIVFEFDQTIVISRLLEGEYFHIDQMLSGDYDTKFSVNKKEMLNCIDRATLLVKEGDKKPIIMDIRNDEMTLTIKSAMGNMREDVAIAKEGKDIMIGFNPKFLIDALRAIDEEEIKLYMINPKAPCFIKDERESYIYLILPVNFNANR